MELPEKSVNELEQGYLIYSSFSKEKKKMERFHLTKFENFWGLSKFRVRFCQVLGQFGCA